MATQQSSGKVYTQTNNDMSVFCGQSGALPELARDICEGSPDEQRTTRVEHHIKNNDYFRTLAAVLHVISTDKAVNKSEVLSKLVCDLLYMHDNYKIVRK